MSVDDYRQQDLFHIEKMILELERLMQNGPIIAERKPDLNTGAIVSMLW